MLSNLLNTPAAHDADELDNTADHVKRADMRVSLPEDAFLLPPLLFSAFFLVRQSFSKSPLAVIAYDARRLPLLLLLLLLVHQIWSMALVGLMVGLSLLGLIVMPIVHERRVACLLFLCLLALLSDLQSADWEVHHPS